MRAAASKVGRVLQLYDVQRKVNIESGESSPAASQVGKAGIT